MTGLDNYNDTRHTSIVKLNNQWVAAYGVRHDMPAHKVVYVQAYHQH